jgi:hypothetical protein
MSRRRLQSKARKAQRHAPPRDPAAIRVFVRQAERVERLAYTRAQAAEALGVSRSTFDRRVLPYVETVELPSGTRLVPVDELERLLRERRSRTVSRPPTVSRGRPRSTEGEIVRRIREERADGRTLREIAIGLDSNGVPTAHGGLRWWPSTVRAVLQRAEKGSVD